MIEFYTNTNGLAEHHLSENPLFEKIYTPPSFGEKLISRVYRDGSLYYLNQERESHTNYVPVENWRLIGKISERGTTQIGELVKTVCSLKDKLLKQSSGNDGFIWRLDCANVVYEFRYSGITEGDYSVFDQITDVVNSA